MLGYALCYALWLITGAGGLFDAYIIWQWVREGYILLQLHRWGFAAAYEFGIVILGLIWLVAIIAFEYYYRRWLVKGTLWKRFRVIAVITAIPILLRLLSIIP